MPEISIQRQCATLNDLTEAETFGDELGVPSRQTANNFFEQDDSLYAGTWECEPGIMKLDLELMEFCHLLEGHWKLTSESGEVTEIRAGDSWIFPRGWKGTSEVIEKVRKVYFIME